MKIIHDNGEEFMLLDTPTEYLCGPWFGFYCQDKFHVFKNCDKDNPYTLMNLKAGKSVNRLTVEYRKFSKKKADIGDEEAPVPDIKAQFFADVYYSKNELNCVFFYSIKNNCSLEFKDIRLFNLFDFDIGGLSNYDCDYAYFDEEYNAIVQNDGTVHVGFCSLEEFPAAHHQAGHPYEIKIDASSPSLNDMVLKGPDDFFSGLEWDLGDLAPGQYKIVPVVLAAGDSREEFYYFLRDGMEKARKILPTMPRIIMQSERQKFLTSDGLVEKMNKALKGNGEKEC
ncbi:MAG TPA: hypothetical protein VKM55_10640 [Candidatus Lokiarchaeia archaeon]|nr:hypothetical protein [Candidatus Lokiarchaeia archaeon]